MCKKLIYLVSFIFMLSLVNANVVFCVNVVESRVNSSSDDNEEDDRDGGMEGAGSGDLEMPYEDEGIPPSDKQLLGLRFTDNTVPKNANITNAYITFICDETKNGTAPVNLIIRGELSPNAATFSESDFDISSRPGTTAMAKLRPVNWTAVGQKDQTSNIAAVIQEIVNQEDWKSGNSLVIIIDDDPDSPSKGIRCAESFDGDASMAPLLHIEYSD